MCTDRALLVVSGALVFMVWSFTAKEAGLCGGDGNVLGRFAQVSCQSVCSDRQSNFYYGTAARERCEIYEGNATLHPVAVELGVANSNFLQEGKAD